MNVRMLALGLALLAAVTQAQVASETTEDGLVRMPSSRKVGVYRAPDVPFARYKRITLGSIPVTFRKSWERTNPDVTNSDRERIRAELVRLFREELVSELVERGGYALAADAAPDVLRIDASIVDLDIAAPNAGTVPGTRSSVRSAGSMRLIVELRDAASGVLVGRIIDFERAREFRDLQPANQVTNAEEARVAFASAARYTRAALNVASTERN